MKLIQGLYAITPDTLDTPWLVAQVKSALQGGASVLQYRNKVANAEVKFAQASALSALCKEYAVPFIVNDDVALCKQTNADGVHLGGSDGDIASARKLLGPHKLIGASCYNLFELAEAAKMAGADYVAFGACFASSTKPNAPVAELNLFTKAKSLGLPAVAIGGITLENAPSVIHAGATSIAVINALFASKNVELTASRFKQLFVS
jgi:thiamine-phosphate pyrophosphorylase